jgi:poly-gamma-glutamate capsule biosynthesis protein CapA/YwtB (metallophosphatase superfamily)
MVEEEINPNPQPLPTLEQHLSAVPPPPQKNRRKLVLMTIIAALTLLLLAALAYFLLIANKSADAPGTDESDENNSGAVEQPKTHLTMLATGDFIAHDAINNEAKQADGSYDYAPMLEPFKYKFADADINFCNQATIAGGEQFGISGYPVFNAPLEWIHDLKGVGCNVINVGTNHTNDKGQRAITAMLNEWDKQEVLAVAGANRSTEEQNQVRYFEIEGVKFALLSYSTYANIENPNSYSLNRFSEPLVTNQMTEARKHADIVIVSMRWGTEYSEVLNAAQEEQSQKLASLGADIVLGHGTHTLQPVKRLTSNPPAGGDRETIVWYGLGNFLNAQLETTGLTGCVATFSIEIVSKKLTDSTCLPFYQHYEWTAEQKAAEDLLSRKNFRIMPLYKSSEYMSKSQLETTVEAQMTRISELVNQYTKIPVQNADDL